MSTRKNIAIIIPCYNEEKTIVKVIRDFKNELSDAQIVVVDNNSSDNTNKLARKENTTVLSEPRRGKGNAVRRAFSKINADIYILVDGDDTYPAEEVNNLLEQILKGEADMTVGSRFKYLDDKSLKLVNKIGNRIITELINIFFRTKFTDVLSGYRIVTKDFVLNIPLFSRGFEIETEFTLQALEKNFRIKEIPIKYRPRHIESKSKLIPFRDGYKVLMTIAIIVRDFKPMIFFPAVSFILIVLSLIWGIPVIKEYIENRYVYRIPSAILASSLFILSLLFLMAGFIIHTINRRFDEIYFLLKKKK